MLETEIIIIFVIGKQNTENKKYGTERQVHTF